MKGLGEVQRLMTSPAVQRFLDNQSPNLRRAALEQDREDPEKYRDDLLEEMVAWGESWRLLCSERGLPCPAALVELGDAMANVWLHLRVEADERRRIHSEPHSYAMLTPAAARDQLDFLLEWSESSVACVELLPVFGQDGDLLLLARDGRVHAWGHDEPRSTEIVADSLEALLDHATTVPVDPRPPG
jgi:hypothetical protein